MASSSPYDAGTSLPWAEWLTAALKLATALAATPAASTPVLCRCGTTCWAPPAARAPFAWPAVVAAPLQPRPFPDAHSRAAPGGVTAVDGETGWPDASSAAERETVTCDAASDDCGRHAVAATAALTCEPNFSGGRFAARVSPIALRNSFAALACGDDDVVEEAADKHSGNVNEANGEVTMMA